MLTDTRIRNAKTAEGKPYKPTEAKGLYLEIKPTGSTLWRYRYRIGGKENVFAAGEYAVAPGGETADQAMCRSAGSTEGRQREGNPAQAKCGGLMCLPQSTFVLPCIYAYQH